MALEVAIKAIIKCKCQQKPQGNNFIYFLYFMIIMHTLHVNSRSILWYCRIRRIHLILSSLFPHKFWVNKNDLVSKCIEIVMVNLFIFFPSSSASNVNSKQNGTTAIISQMEMFSKYKTIYKTSKQWYDMHNWSESTKCNENWHSVTFLSLCRAHENMSHSI